MMNSTRKRRNTKRVIGLGLAMLSMSLLGSVTQAASNNITAGTATVVPMNTGVFDTVATQSDTKFFLVQMFAGRTYEISAYNVNKDFTGTPAFDGAARVATDSAFTNLVAVTQTTSDPEGGVGSNGGSCCRSRHIFIPAVTSGRHYVEIPTNFSTGSWYFSIRETTMFSPWLSKSAGFEGFIELHNNTNATVSVTLKGYNSAGALQGAGLTFTIPGNATVFKTGADIGVPVGVAAGVVLTHNASFGAISGNITTLNGANGLSFDSPFTPRSEQFRVH